MYRGYTVKSDGAFGFAERVLRDALVVAEIRLAQVSDGQPHVDAIAVLRVRRHVLLVGKQHRLRIAKRPIVYRLRIRLGLAIDRHVRAGRRADQLIRYPYHWRDCKEHEMIIIINSYVLLIAITLFCWRVAAENGKTILYVLRV